MFESEVYRFFSDLINLPAGAHMGGFMRQRQHVSTPFAKRRRSTPIESNQ